MKATKILVVEDDRIVAEDIKNSLKKMGFDVPGIVPSGEEALEKVKVYSPDLVLMDIMLKGEMNGTEAADQIQTRFNIPVVYLTAYTDENILDRAKITEPFGYVVKPFEDRELNTAIEIAIYKHKMEKKLKENEAWLSTTLKSIGDALIATDIKGSVTFMNPAAQALTGWSHDKAIGKSLKEVFNIINEDTRAQVENPIDEVIRKDTIDGLANHTILISKDGKEIPIDDSGAPIRDNEGNTIGVVLVFRDITERKQSEDALRRNQEMLSQAQQLANLGSWVWDYKTGEVQWSEEVYRIFGQDSKVFTPQIDSIMSQFHPDDMHFREELIKKIIENREQYTLEPRILLPDGSLRHIISISKGHFDDNGNIVYFTGTIQDITERKSAEKALRESEERFRVLFENAASCIIFVVDRVMNYFNQATLDTFGYTKDEMVGRSTSLIHATRESYEESGRIAYDAMQKEGKWNGELLFRKKNGETMWMDTHLATLPEVGIVAILNDVTERRKAVDEKIKLQKQLQQSQKMESIGTLAGGIAHEFNNMLGVMLGNTELAMDDIPEWSPARHNLEEVKAASLRAKDVIRQLLSFSHKTEQSKRPIKIASIIKESLKLLRSSIPTTIDIRQNIVSGLDTIVADPTQIHQVIINLCTNAAHAMREDGGILSVNLTNAELGEDYDATHTELTPGKYVKLSVEDTGHGVSPEIQDQVFDPYFTTKEVGEGTGMGLAVVHGIIRSHGGSISVSSTPGNGARFEMFFPIVETIDVDNGISSSEPVPKGNEHILLIDDDKLIVRMVKQMLERLGYKVTVQTGSIEALEEFRSQPDKYDLVISDMTMPNMTGDRLAQKMLDIKSDIPVILCTGFSERIDNEKARSIGVRALVMKPIEKNKLAKTIRNILDQ